MAQPVTVTTPFDLSPSDAAPYFFPPKQTLVNILAAGGLIIGADILRSVLILSFQSGFVGIKPGATDSSGIIMSNSFPCLILTARDHGPLVTQAWYNNSNANMTGSTIAVTMNDWTDKDSVELGIENLVQTAKPATVRLPTAPGVNGKRGVLDYWNRITAALRGKE